jgi:hypothetical protein
VRAVGRQHVRRPNLNAIACTGGAAAIVASPVTAEVCAPAYRGDDIAHDKAIVENVVVAH